MFRFSQFSAFGNLSSNSPKLYNQLYCTCIFNYFQLVALEKVDQNSSPSKIQEQCTSYTTKVFLVSHAKLQTWMHCCLDALVSFIFYTWGHFQARKHFCFPLFYIINIFLFPSESVLKLSI